MAGFGRVLGFGLLVGGAVVGGVLLTAKASPRPRAKFRAGDVVTVTGGPVGTTTTYVVRGALWTASGWQYDLGTGAPMPQGALHMVEPAK